MSSFDEVETDWILNYSVIMVGNYLLGSNETKQKATGIHNNLVPDLFSKLLSLLFTPYHSTV